MHSIRVEFANGDSLTTSINGTPDEIREYYYGNTFNVGLNGRRRTTRAVNGIDENVKLNRALFTLAEQMMLLKAGA